MVFNKKNRLKMNIRFCKKCLYPETKPDLFFDEEKRIFLKLLTIIGYPRERLDMTV